MKILLIDPAFYSPFYDLALMNGLAGIDVDVKLASSPFVHTDIKIPDDLIVLDLFFHLSKFKLISQSAWLRKIFRAIEYPFNWLVLFINLLTSDYDCIHFQWVIAPKLDFYLILLLKKLFRIPVVYTAHNALPHEEKRRNKNVYRKIYKLVDKIITLTAHEKNKLLSFTQIDSNKVSVIPHGGYLDLVSQCDQDRIHEKIPNPNNKKIVAFCGLIKPYKGLDILLEAFREVHNNEEVLLAVLGKPQSDFSEYQRLIERFEIPSEDLYLDLRYLPLPTMMDYIKQADVAVLPYRSATQSGQVVFYYELGIPVIASAVGGLHEQVFNHKTGMLFPNGDVEQLAKTILLILGKSPEEISMMREEMYSIISAEFSWESIAKSTFEVYEDVTSKR